MTRQSPPRSKFFTNLFTYWWLASLLATVAGAQTPPGDANGDGVVDTLDLPVIVDHVLARQDAPGLPDCNRDDGVDVLDGICVVRVTEAEAPVISGLEPGTATIGDVVTLVGQHLSSPTGAPPRLELSSRQGGLLEAMVTVHEESSVVFSVPAGAVTGPVRLTLPGPYQAQSPAPLTIEASTSFSLRVEPASVELIRGQTAAMAVTLETSDGFDQLASLRARALPAGVTASFSPPQITGGRTAILNLEASPQAAAGSSIFEISATATVEGLEVDAEASATLEILPVSTAFIGRTVVADPLRTPLAGVMVSMLGVDGSGQPTGCTGQTVSDAAGNFALTGLPAACAGEQLIRYDGSTAVAPPGEYAGVDLLYVLTAGQVTVSPVLVHLPRIDNAETVWVEQDADEDQHFTFASIPDMSLTVYAGTTLTLRDGGQPDPFPLIAVRVPVDRLPEETPPSQTVDAFIVAFQPANATASQPVAVYYPNLLDTEPGTSMALATLDPTRGVMVEYGTGEVAEDGRQIVPDFDPAYPGQRYGIVHFDWHGPWAPPPPRRDPGCKGAFGACCPTAGKPIDLTSGIEVMSVIDYSLQGSRGSLEIVRTYRTLTEDAGPFGPGTGHNYGLRLDTTSAIETTRLNLIMPDGKRWPFVRRSDGTFTNSTVPWLQGAVMTPFGNQASLRFKDGTTYLFAGTSVGSLLVSISDANGNTTRLERDPSAPIRILEIVDPVGRRLYLDYEGGNRISSITDPIGRTVLYTYDGQGRLSTVEDAEGGISRYEYDGQGRLWRVFDARGVLVARNVFDDDGRVIEQRQGDGGVLKIDYALANPDLPSSPVLQTTVTDPLNRQTVYRFDTEQFVLDVTDELGQVRVFERNADHRVEAVHGTSDCETCGGEGGERFTYDGVGNVLSQTDALGATTHYTYEPLFHRVTSITDPLDRVTSFEYDERGNLTTLTDANGHARTFAYDMHGQMIEAVDPLGHPTTFEYDGFGNLIATTDPLGATTLFLYDAVSRLIETEDALGNRTYYEYDGLDRVTSITDANGGITLFEYDEVGNLTAVTDANGNTNRFTYDAMNRLVTRMTPLGFHDLREYDFAGNLVRFVDRRGQTSLYTYDALDRLTSEVYEDSTVDRAYDARGNLIWAEDSMSGIFTWSYDAADRLLASSTPVGSLEYERDLLGRTLSRTTVGLSTVEYSYDPVGNLLTASMPRTEVTMVYSATNRPEAIERPNGVVSFYSFDSTGRLLDLGHQRPEQLVEKHRYVYGPTGNISEYMVTSHEDLPVLGDEQRSHNESNQLIEINGAALRYDANGNLTYWDRPGAPISLKWDSRDRVSQINEGDAGYLFRHGPQGQLLTREEVSLAGSLVGRQEFMHDEFLNPAVVSSQRSGEWFAIVTGRDLDQHLAYGLETGDVYSVLTDAAGNTTAILDSEGRILQRFSYSPFGASLQVSSSSFFHGFAGRNLVAPSFYYNRFRFYSPELKRFVSEDPIKETGGGWNFYLYANNNPVSARDPLGLSPLPFFPCRNKFQFCALSCKKRCHDPSCFALCLDWCERMHDACLLTGRFLPNIMNPHCRKKDCP